MVDQGKEQKIHISKAVLWVKKSRQGKKLHFSNRQSKFLMEKTMGAQNFNFAFKFI